MAKTYEYEVPQAILVLCCIKCKLPLYNAIIAGGSGRPYCRYGHWFPSLHETIVILQCTKCNAGLKPHDEISSRCPQCHTIFKIPHPDQS